LFKVNKSGINSKWNWPNYGEADIRQSVNQHITQIICQAIGHPCIHLFESVVAQLPDRVSCIDFLAPTEIFKLVCKHG
jgi:hypothetical protein